MLESSGPLKGTFRIRSTGFAGKSKVAIVATFKPASFLDYVYFTQLETSDPVTYGDRSSTKSNGAYEQCGKDDRTKGATTANDPELERRSYCDVISFVSGDNIKGRCTPTTPSSICGNPTLGRSAADPIEVSGPAARAGSRPRKSSTPARAAPATRTSQAPSPTNSPVLIPPATNSELATIAEPAFNSKARCGSASTARR